MDIKHVKTLIHLAASRLENRHSEEDREIADLLRQAERALARKEEERPFGSRVSALSPMDQARSWDSNYAGQGLSLGALSEDVE